MKLVDMKKPKIDPKKEKGMVAESPEMYRERYPYGLRIDLETETIAKLKGVESLDVGDSVDIVAIGKVVQKSVNEQQDTKKKTRIEIQIIKLAIGDKENFDQAFDEIMEK